MITIRYIYLKLGTYLYSLLLSFETPLTTRGPFLESPGNFSATHRIFN